MTTGPIVVNWSQIYLSQAIFSPTKANKLVTQIKNKPSRIYFLFSDELFLGESAKYKAGQPERNHLYFELIQQRRERKALYFLHFDLEYKQTIEIGYLILHKSITEAYAFPLILTLPDLTHQ